MQRLRSDRGLLPLLCIKHIRSSCPLVTIKQSVSTRKTRLQATLYVSVLCLFVLVMFHTDITLINPDIANVEPRAADPKFLRALHQQVDANQSVLLAMVDAAFVDIAINFYLTSLNMHGIQNYLFVGVSDKACKVLHQYDPDIACHMYTDDADSDSESVFNSKAFIRKTNLRTEMILDALLAGVTVVHSDVDVIFLNNPMSDLLTIDADVTAMWDTSSYNAGFLAIKPTKPSIWIYDRIRKLCEEGSMRNDQHALDESLGRCARCGVCTLAKLDTKKYLNGKAYFEEGAHTFADQKPCTACVVVHDNFIVSKAAKIYRLKENRMWIYDKEGYYSSKANNYLTFQINLFENQTNQQQQVALGNALIIGQILNRIVILPQFQCESTVDMCALNSLIKITTFDKQFLPNYRESTFLSHPLVPAVVTDSITNTYYIANEKSTSKHDLDSIIIKTSSTDNRLTSGEILHWFGTVSSHVLSLGYLHELSIVFDDDKEDEMFKTMLQNAFQECDYRQFC